MKFARQMSGSILLMLFILLSCCMLAYVVGCGNTPSTTSNSGTDPIQPTPNPTTGSGWSMTADQINEAIAASGGKVDWIAEETEITKTMSQQEFSKLNGYRLPPSRDMLTHARKFKSEGRALPATFVWDDKDGKNWMTSVKDQDPYGTCTSFATIAALEVAFNLYFNDPDADPDLSESFIIHYGTQTIFNNLIDPLNTGWWAADPNYDGSLQILQKSGTVDEIYCPYTNPYSFTPPPEDVTKIKVDKYGFAVGINDMKEALIKHGPLITHMNAEFDFAYYGKKNDGKVYVPTTFGPYPINHSILIIGWFDNPGAWICKNSYGSGWGYRGGYFAIPFNNVSTTSTIVTGTQQVDGYYIESIILERPSSLAEIHDVQPSKLYYFVGEKITLTGIGFGNSSKNRLEAVAVALATGKTEITPIPTTSWSDKEIIFTVPDGVPADSLCIADSNGSALSTREAFSLCPTAAMASWVQDSSKIWTATLDTTKGSKGPYSYQWQIDNNYVPGAEWALEDQTPWIDIAGEVGQSCTSPTVKGGALACRIKDNYGNFSRTFKQFP